ncbi:Copine-8 [Cryptotermes secundus]|uniref:Copine-3 n=1 Tax=Cryptotermes secundus TaxID=105785 RepID=A0A2J7PFS2_9NEOP|nr:copine-8 isoform X2 [Cryptotermes secundus]PNF15182.1 Copine-8 [Cryptotermes secundus]PNF15183.1 Copine-8 [Cryptotermes secundus]
MARFIPGSASEPSSEVELTISCRNLLDCDVFSKSDPMCVTYLKNFEVMEWQEVARTETINNTLNPNFTKKVHVLYRFEEQQHIKFEVYDVDTYDPSLEKQDFLGQCVTTLGHIVSSGKVTLPLMGMPCNKGELTVVAEELAVCRDEVLLQFSGRNLDRKDWFGKSDPFLEFYKVSEDGEYHVVHRTEEIKWTLNPNWKPFVIPVRSLCSGDMDRSIRVLCYDWNRSGNHSLIGEFFVTLNELSAGPGPYNVHPCIHPTKQQQPSYKNSGEIILVRYEYRKVYSFLDYIMGGLQLNCTIAIDFTASNGDPQSPDSLHFFSSSMPNQYEQALTAVGEIIQDYDSDHLFPVLGFGARLPPDGRVSHEFFVNMHPANPYCNGISGVLDAYRTCIRQIQLHGPTNFSPVINHVAKFAETYQDGSQYFILLIVTDGVITDMPRTKQAIIRASTLPMSIIIVGVGNADFTAMNELDADTVPLVFNGVQAQRDIVQFVPFRNFQRLQNVSAAKAYLAKEVLAEVPDQIVGYMKSRNIKPKKLHTQQSSNTSNEAPPPYSEH